MTSLGLAAHPARLRFSASRLGTWMNCPMQAKFRYVDRLPSPQHAAATFGSSVHKALEHYGQTGNLEASLDVFRDYWTNPEKYGIKPDIWPKQQSFGGYMEKGVAAIRNYHETSKWTTRTMLANEHPFLVNFGEYELTGFIDMLELTRNKEGDPVVKITDFKTNARAPYVSNLRLNVQFTVYDYASRQPEFWLGNGPKFPPLFLPGELFGSPEDLWERAQDMRRENIWYGLIQKKEYDAGERDEPDYMRLYRVCKEIEKAITHDVYVPDISGDTCTFCPYVTPCKLPFDPRLDAVG